jgi:glycosyltransferase involved in cell wall biosynthesis
MTTIAIFSTYAPSQGFGGPARIFNIREVLEHHGYRVTNVVVQAAPSGGAVGLGDLHLLAERPFGAHVDHVYGDVDLGRRAAADRRLTARVREHLATSEVDLVVLEQPFLTELALNAMGTDNRPIIYNSQNVEFRLRRDLERFQFLASRPTNRMDEVREIEKATVDAAAAVTTICQTDRAKMMEEFCCDSVIVPNGTALADFPWVPYAGALPARPDFAFAGSSYWPNVEGFARIAQPSLAFLPPTTRIHVAGSAADGLLSVPSIARWHSINASRIELRGFLPMRSLVRLMQSARAVLVPIYVGEGSNLKSADALAAGVPVIMTERASHGYEDVIAADPEGVTVVDSVPGFRHAMRHLLDEPWPAAPIGGPRRELLSWRRRLEPLLGVVQGVLAVNA